MSGLNPGRLRASWLPPRACWGCRAGEGTQGCPLYTRHARGLSDGLEQRLCPSFSSLSSVCVLSTCRLAISSPRGPLLLRRALPGHLIRGSHLSLLLSFPAPAPSTHLQGNHTGATLGPLHPSILDPRTVGIQSSFVE